MPQPAQGASVSGASSKEQFFRLLRYVSPYKGIFLLGILANAVSAATAVAFAKIVQPMVDSMNADLSMARLTAILLVLIFFVRGLASFTASVAFASAGSKVVRDLRTQMFDRILQLPVAYFDRHAAGTTISKLTFDVTQITEGFFHALTIMVRDSLHIIGLLAFMFYIDWQLTLGALLSAPVVMWIVRHFSAKLRAVSRRLQEGMGDITHVVNEGVEGHKVIRSFGGEDYENKRFGVSANNVRRLQVKFTAAAAANSPIAQLITSIALATILYVFAVKHAGEQAVSVGTFVSFVTAMAMLFDPIKRLTGINGPLQRCIAAADSVFGLIDEETEPRHGTLELKSVKGEITFEDVSFSYMRGSDKAQAIENVSFTVSPGETVALVGPSGSGKTTLASLLCGFYVPDRGHIKIDGIDTQEVKRASLRRSFSLVSQDVILFQGTVAQNIAYGDLASCPREDIEAAARAANALDFIEALDGGLDAHVGPNGVMLSGGQRQRLAIARAFLKNAPILILDEATSSLDTAVERDIQRAVEELRAERTTIVIAHRLSTVENADHIIVLNEGRVEDIGTHSSLLDTSALYASLYRFQLGRTDEDGSADPTSQAR